MWLLYATAIAWVLFSERRYFQSSTFPINDVVDPDVAYEPKKHYYTQHLLDAGYHPDMEYLYMMDATSLDGKQRVQGEPIRNAPTELKYRPAPEEVELWNWGSERDT